MLTQVFLSIFDFIEKVDWFLEATWYSKGSYLFLNELLAAGYHYQDISHMCDS